MIQRLQVLWISPIHLDSCNYFTHLAGRLPFGRRWELTVDEAVHALMTRSLSFYILRRGRVIDLVTADYKGQPYLSCSGEGCGTVALLTLPAFKPEGL